MRTLWLLSCLCLLVSSCFPIAGVTHPSDVELRDAYYGPPPPENYKEIVEDRIKRDLIDPYSAQFEFSGNPIKAWTYNEAWSGPQFFYGWGVCGTVNAKNRMGGYSGRKLFMAFFQSGALFEIYHESRASTRGCRY